MKKIFIIGAVIIIAFVFILVNKSKKNEINNQNSQLVAQDIQLQTLTENQKALSVSNSNFVWTGKKTIVKDWVDTGTIRLREGFVTLDQDVVVGGQAVIDMTSITASTTGSGNGQDKLSEHLKSADFFDAANHPTATIVVKRIFEGTAYADVVIKGITKSVEFPVTIEKVGDTHMITGKLSLNRTWFDVKFGSKAFFSDLVDQMVIDDVFIIDFKVVTQ